MGNIKDLINSDKISGIIVLIGDEKFLINRYKNLIIQKLEMDSSDINFSYYTTKINAENVKEIISIVNTLPFLADKRLVVLEDTKLYEFSEFEKVLDIAETTILLIIESSIDKRTKFYKAIKNKARIFEYNSGDISMHIGAVKLVVKEENMLIDNDAIDYIIDNSENDMYSITNNTKKVVSYVSGNRITLQDVKKVIAPLAKNYVFEMIRSISMKDAKNTIKLYKDLKYLKEPPFKIMALIYREYKMIASVMDNNISSIELSKKLGLREFAVNNYKSVSKKLDKKEVIEALNLCIDLEKSIKQGKVSDELGLENLILKLLENKRKM